jgi:hypothetical protein
MANSTISLLPQAISITGVEQMEAVQAGVSVRVTTAQIAQLVSTTTPPQTVANLGAPTAGVRAMVSDATVTTFATIVAGGGTNTVPVFADGSNWWIG